MSNSFEFLAHCLEKNICVAVKVKEKGKGILQGIDINTDTIYVLSRCTDVIKARMNECSFEPNLKPGRKTDSINNPNQSKNQ